MVHLRPKLKSLSSSTQPATKYFPIDVTIFPRRYITAMPFRSGDAFSYEKELLHNHHNQTNGQHDTIN